MALDYNGKAVITGGTFVSTGMQEMAQTFDSSSTQNFITVYYDSTVAAGTEIKVTDKDGNTVLSYNADKEFTFAVISSDKLSTGEKYTVTAGGSTIGERSAGGPGGPNGNGGPGGNPPTGQPPQKSTDANGNEIEMSGLPSGESSQTEKIKDIFDKCI